MIRSHFFVEIVYNKEKTGSRRKTGRRTKEWGVFVNEKRAMRNKTNHCIVKKEEHKPDSQNLDSPLLSVCLVYLFPFVLFRFFQNGRARISGRYRPGDHLTIKKKDSFPPICPPKTSMFLMVFNQFARLFPVNDVHPPDGFHLTHPAQIGLGGLQILVPEDHLGHDFQGNPVPAGIGC